MVRKCADWNYQLSKTYGKGRIRSVKEIEAEQKEKEKGERV